MTNKTNVYTITNDAFTNNKELSFE